MSGDDELLAWADRLKGASATIFVDAADECRPLVYAVSQATAAAGVNPNTGEAWRLRKDGQRAIPKAAEVLKVRSKGSVVQIRVSGGTAIQNYISPKNRRQVLPDPDQPLPSALVEAMTKGCNTALRKATGG